MLPVNQLKPFSLDATARLFLSSVHTCSLLQDKWDPFGVSAAALAGEDCYGGKRGALVEGASAVLYLAGGGTMTFVDAKTGALHRELEIVPGRMIVWDNSSLLHKVDVGDTSTPRVMLGMCPCASATVFARQRQCTSESQGERGRDVMIIFVFIIADTARAKGESINMVVGVVRDLKAKAGGDESLAHTRWSGGMGNLRRGKRIRDERFGSGRGECVCLDGC